METAVTIPRFLARFAARGDKLFLVTPDEELTYAEADEQSAELVCRFLALGVSKNTRVALVLGNGSDWVVTFFALARIGADSILSNPFARAPELTYALRHSDTEMVITGTATGGADGAALLAAAVPGLADRDAGDPAFIPSHPYLRGAWWIGAGRPDWASDPHSATPVSRQLLAAVEAEVHPSDLMITSYTSGTTAEPKAVVHSQGAILRQAEKLAVRRRFTDDDRIYGPLPLFWVGGLAFVFLSAVAHGGLFATDARFDALRALDLLEKYDITHVSCWPQAAEAMVNHPTFPDRDFSRLRSGPANLRGEAWANVAPDQRETSLGMTETCGPHSWPFDPDVILPDNLRGSFGPAMENMEHRIVDRETGEPLPDGEIGELLVRGECLMVGFHKREREDTFEADGWYRTGDLCSWRDDRLFFHGHGGDMIKTAGFNVAPAEVEKALEGLDDVLHAAVFGLPDPVREQAVGALVAIRPGSNADVESLRAGAAEQLSSYKVPTVWRIVERAEFPMAVTGKTDRPGARRLLTDA